MLIDDDPVATLPAGPGVRGADPGAGPGARLGAGLGAGPGADRGAGAGPGPDRWHRTVPPPARARRLLLLAGVLVFVVLAVAVRAGGPPPAFDARIRSWVAGHQVGWLRHLADAGINLGNPELIIPLAVLASAALAWRRRSWRPVPSAAATVLLLIMTVLAVKGWLARPGPDPGIAPADNGAWPSGHTTTAVTMWGLLAMVSTASGPARRRALCAVAVIGLVTGLMLVYGDYHWASDVLAGWVLGSVILGAVAALTPDPHPPGGG